MPKNSHVKYIGVKQVKSLKMQAAEQDQTVATRTVAHKKIKISVNLVNTQCTSVRIKTTQ
jgi:hypothetical protein